jgi:hypothetical protein
MAHKRRGTHLPASTTVARPIKRRCELAVDEFFNEAPHGPAAQLRSDQNQLSKSGSSIA